MSRLSEETKRRAGEMIRAGGSNRWIADQLGIARHSVARLRSEQPWSAGTQQQPPAPQYSTMANAALDQPPPPPQRPQFDPQYHGRTFKTAVAQPAAFGPWTLDRVRNAIELHNQGTTFLESSMLARLLLRFAPVSAAVGQAMAPSLSLPRHVLGSSRGLGRVLRDAVEQQLSPRAGLLPSPFFPPMLYGQIDFELMQMGFAVLQHAYGDAMDVRVGDTVLRDVRPVWTRLWPGWAVQYQSWRQTYVALTVDGAVDIVSGDGKFTMIADSSEPHRFGAIMPAGLEVLEGFLTKQARASYIDRYGNPKWVGTMPEKVGTGTPEGEAFFDAMLTLQSPNGYGALPYGSKFDVVEMSGNQSTVFKDALDNIWQYVAAVYLGSDGTMSKGSGVYSAPIFAGVRRDIIARKLAAMVRGINMGHVSPWLLFNFEATIAAARGWEDPVLDIPLPDPDADARMKSYAERQGSLYKLVQDERAAGFVVTQDRVNQLAEQLDLTAPTLATATPSSAISIPQTDAIKFIKMDEGRAVLGYGPMGDERGNLTVLEMEQGEEEPNGDGGATTPPASSPPPGTQPESPAPRAPSQEQAA